ncbi:MAG: hypothetical protein JTT11_05860 [Candidatus Brockarchaeota archaeon]|nr:hypothetical protein [Candidatus Brockarchaeota archaeon]
MIELKLWQSGDDFDEAPLRGVMAINKFWKKDVAKACVDLGGINFERGYRYQVFVCFDRQDKLKDIIKKLILWSPGSLKWINLLLYGSDEKSACEDLKKVADFNDLMDDIRRNEEKAKELAIRYAHDYLKIDLNPRKKVVPEYIISIGYLIQMNDDQAIVYIVGLNYKVDEMIRNSREDFNKFGKVVGYCVEEVEKADLIDVEEEEDAYYVLLEV